MSKSEPWKSNHTQPNRTLCPNSGEHVLRTLSIIALTLLSGCVRTPFLVPPPPAVPERLVTPATPAVQSEATSFEPEVTVDAVGRERLRLKSETIGLAPIADTDLLSDLHDELLTALLAGGFRQVIDLSAAQAVTASHSRSGRGEEFALKGKMSDLMTITPVSRARLLITGDVVQSGRVERTLPVRFWYVDADIDQYQAKVEAWSKTREARLAEVEAARTAYFELFREAELQYTESRPWWQKLVDGVVEPSEKKARDAYFDELQGVASSMHREPIDGPGLQEEAAQRDESQAVTIYTARLRLQVQQPDTGEVLAIIQVGAEGRTPAELMDNLAGVTQAALGAR